MVSQVVSLWVHGISNVPYISVNKSNYQWENARLMKPISITNNINSLAHGDKYTDNQNNKRVCQNANTILIILRFETIHKKKTISLLDFE